jgi:hypothetical protein
MLKLSVNHYAQYGHLATLIRYILSLCLSEVMVYEGLVSTQRLYDQVDLLVGLNVHHHTATYMLA